MGIKTILTILITLIISSQNRSDEQRKLSINDYKGLPDNSVPFLAYTTCGVFYKLSPGKPCSGINKIYLILSTELKLIENHSWIKVSKLENEQQQIALLSHEQGHYDIFYVFNKNLQFILSNRCFDKSKYKFEADSIYQVMYNHYDLLQRKYDLETEHSANKLKQDDWKKQLQLMIEDAAHHQFR
jgi:hypothetical protein